MNGPISIKAIAEKLKNEKSAAIFCHIRPDGDAIGSAVALCHALKSLGKRADVFCSDSIPERFSCIDGVKDIRSVFSGEYSAFVAVDCADTGRIGEFGSEFSKRNNTYNIDHHISNTRYAKYNCVVDNASNCENVFDLIKAMNCPVTESIADALATGVVTDTGNFKHKNVTSKTFYTAAELKERGADFNKIVYRMFTEQTPARAKLFGLVMSKIRYLLDGKLAVASVFKSDLEKSGALPDETEGFIDFVMGIKGVEVGVCIMQTDEDNFKCSFRSKSADVNAVAGRFGGGGHILASGCRIQGEYEEVIDDIRYAVSQQIPD